MFNTGESIYNLIPKEVEIESKRKRYKSCYPSNIPPTYSTLCHKTTTRPGITNPNGSFVIEGGTHSHKADYATFGQSKGISKLKPNEFTKKGTRYTISVNSKNCHYKSQERKPPIPDKTDKPIMGLVSEKNYIISNAVENILSAPKNVDSKNVDYLKKNNYGKVPHYIEKIKKDVEDEYQIVKELHAQEEDEKLKEKYLMPDDERRDLIAALKKKWDLLHHKYQEKSYYTKMPTIGFKRRLFNLEKSRMKRKWNY